MKGLAALLAALALAACTTTGTITRSSTGASSQNPASSMGAPGDPASATLLGGPN